MRALNKRLLVTVLVILLGAGQSLADAVPLPEPAIRVQLLTQLYMPDEDYYRLADMVSAVNALVRDDAQYQGRGIGTIKVRVSEWMVNADEAAELRKIDEARSSGLPRPAPEPNADGMVTGHLVQALIRGLGAEPSLPQSGMDALTAFIEDYIRTHSTLLEPALTHVDCMLSAGKPRMILAKFADMYQRNDDMVGWIQIEGTPLNDPVMYTPADSEYYLDRDFDGQEALSGTPFLDSRCDPDEPSGNLIVYAHNMKSGARFGSLKEYESERYWRAHPTIRFDLLGEEGEYEIFGMFRSKMYAEGEAGFRYYEYIDFASQRRFLDFVEGVLAASYVDTGVTPVWGDRILTLSTCSRYVDGGTFVVVARRVGP